MSPELLDPDQFGPKDGRPTKESDRYALGMVIYEVLSGKVPFEPYREYVVMRKVIEGERPERPEGEEGARFTDNLWQTLQRCWAQESRGRPGIDVILGCLEPAPTNSAVSILENPLANPPSPQFDGPPEIIIEALRTKFRSFVLRLGEQMEALINERGSVLSFLVSHSFGSYRWCAQRCAANGFSLPYNVLCHPTFTCVLIQSTQDPNSCEPHRGSRTLACSQVFHLLQAGMREQYREQGHVNLSDGGQQGVRKVLAHNGPTPTQLAVL